MTPTELSEVILQVVASPMIVILTTLDVLFMLPDNIYGTGITHCDRHLQSLCFYSTGHLGMFRYFYFVKKTQFMITE